MGVNLIQKIKVMRDRETRSTYRAMKVVGSRTMMCHKSHLYI